MKTLHYTLVWFMTRGVAYFVQRWDRSRLSEEARETAWNGASWGSAVYNFAHLSMIAWVWVSRPRWPWWLRLLVGLLAFIVLEVALDLVDWGLVSLAGLPDL